MEAPILKISPEKFLELSGNVPIIDVRAPKEYAQGHMPGAINMPLFDDSERDEVGISYTQKNRETALLKGLGIAGPKLKDFASSGKKIAADGELLVHCWRGGMRSEAMAWLFNFSGIKTSVLEGGYKSYRRYIRDSWLNGPPIIVLGGMTGSGKTIILKHMSELGEQVLDLESLAHHKGSAFGALGQADQPTNEQFENNLAAKWLAFDYKKSVWIEDESRSIGKMYVPEPLYLKMAAAPLVFIDVPFDARVKRLTGEYGSFNISDLSALIRKIGPRLGTDKANEAIRDLEQGNLIGAISSVLTYYDKTYLYGLSKHPKNKILTIPVENEELHAISAEIIRMKQNLKLES